MRDIDIHFRKIEDNKYWLLYNQESFEKVLILEEDYMRSIGIIVGQE